MLFRSGRRTSKIGLRLAGIEDKFVIATKSGDTRIVQNWKQLVLGIRCDFLSLQRNGGCQKTKNKRIKCFSHGTNQWLGREKMDWMNNVLFGKRRF